MNDQLFEIHATPMREHHLTFGGDGARVLSDPCWTRDLQLSYRLLSATGTRLVDMAA